MILNISKTTIEIRLKFSQQSTTILYHIFAQNSQNLYCTFGDIYEKPLKKQVFRSENCPSSGQILTLKTICIKKSEDTIGKGNLS